MLINCTLQEMIDGDLCLAFAVAVVPRHDGWTAEHKPMIFFPSSPMPPSLNNSICIHQSRICHSWYVLPGSLPSMLCSRCFDSPISVQVSRDQPPHGRRHFTALAYFILLSQRLVIECFNSMSVRGWHFWLLLRRGSALSWHLIGMFYFLRIKIKGIQIYSKSQKS